MKKIIFGIVALLIATFGLYAFTNTGDSESVETETLNVYHTVGEDENGDILFVSGPSTDPNCKASGVMPCEFHSSSSLTSPMSQEEIESIATIDSWRN